MKRPSFQFYPSDWLRDTALRTCSVGARGLWMDMICFMHEGTPYGHLKVNNKVILPDNLARMVGETLNTVEGYLRELSDAGVFEYDEDGAIFSRRMVKDEKVRNVRADGGKKGGNPALIASKDNHKDNHKVNDKVKQKPTPSSSSSSSSSNRNRGSSVDKPDDVSDEVWNQFLMICKAKNKPVGEIVLKKMYQQANAKGLTLEQALIWCCEQGFARFESDWVKGGKDQSHHDIFAGAI